MDEAIYHLCDFDRQTERLRFAAVLRGDSTAEIVELTASREVERQRICEEIYGPCVD